MAKAKLLIVDDEIPFLEAMDRRLSKRDFSIRTASDAEAALDILKTHHADIEVVILDVKMPGMDGIEALGEIKRRHPMVEVIMLTGHATVETAIEGMKKGAFDYLMKPADIDNFTTKIMDAVEKRHHHEEKIMAAEIKEITHRMP